VGIGAVDGVVERPVLAGLVGDGRVMPVPTQRLPFIEITGVPPTRESSNRAPSRSTNGPHGLCERPANTL
jgi:hypothetical protein